MPMFRVSFVLVVLLLAANGLAQTTTLSVSIDNSAFSGTSASLAFDLLDGDGSLGNNSVAITGFTSDAALDCANISGGVSGSLPTVTLTDASGFNELLQFLTLTAAIGNPSGLPEPGALALFGLGRKLTKRFFSAVGRIQGGADISATTGRVVL